MTPQEELAALRRMAALEARAKAPAPVPAAPATSEASRSESFLRGGAQGATLGAGDEVQGLMQTLGSSDSPWFMRSPLATLADLTSGVPADQLETARKVDAEREARLTKEMGPGARLRQRYQESRDAARTDDKAAKEAHSGYYLAGNLLGGALTAPLLPGAPLRTAGQAALQGAKLGAAAGLGGSEADLTKGEVGDAAKDTALGSALGALAGAGAQQLPRLVGAVNEKVGQLGQSLAARLGRRVLQGGSETLAKGQAIPDEVALDAIRRGIIRFGGTTKGAAERAAAQAEGAGGLYGDVLEELQKAGVQGPNAHRIAVEVAQDASKRALEHPGAAGPEAMKKFAEALAEQYQPGAADIPLGLAETIKRNLQGDASKLFEAGRRGLLAEGENLGEAKLAVADKMKTAIEDAVQAQGAKAPQAAAAFEPAKREASALIRLRELARKGAAKVENRNPIGLFDMMAAAAEGARHGPIASLATIPASMLARAVGPSSGASAGLAVSEMANALRGLPAVAEQALPGTGRATLTAGLGAAEALQSALARALRGGKKLSPAEDEELRRLEARAAALRQ